MKEAYQKAEILVEALSWIRQFRDRSVVIKLGGSALEDEATVRLLLTDVIFMEAVGMHPVLIHGGGKSINAAMKSAGIEPRWVQGRRYTDEATRDIVERVLAYETNEHVAERIEEFGGRAAPLNFRTTNVLWGERLVLEDEQGRAIDLGSVGTVTRVDRGTISNLCFAGTVPVIPSMCLSETGEKLNVNADTAATAVAQALGAEKLVYMKIGRASCRERV